MMKNIGIILELDHGKIKDINYGMITLTRAEDRQLFGFVMDADAEIVKKDLASYGIHKIVQVSLSPGQQTNPCVRAQAIIDSIGRYNIEAVFGLSTARGKDLLPRVAALLDAPLVMDCIRVDLEKKQAKTSQYSGKTIATLAITGDVPVFGIRPNAMGSARAEVSAEVLAYDGTRIVSKGLRVVSTGEIDDDTAVSLVEADVIIAGGRGMKNGENFTLLSQCAQKINAAVGASRVAVDEGWVPYAMQVGQTGEKVSPKVYIACGISGSIQHYAGMKTSGMVIAINTDDTASIISNCDYYVKADALKIIPELTRLL